MGQARRGKQERRTLPPAAAPAAWRQGLIAVGVVQHPTTGYYQVWLHARGQTADVRVPEDPRLLEDLRSHLAGLDEELTPLRGKLERLDDALAAFEFEIGRVRRTAADPRRRSAGGSRPGGSGSAADPPSVPRTAPARTA